ncbi:conserved hypothetical protein [Trichinella spiralis]|uniref:hypothetical protein n=1 Tax=Trichinella spiralis TaxID=6334 RepID=UPI0001EFCAC0|nr:conserved hypothetical protein [Trichinella spiralis]
MVMIGENDARCRRKTRTVTAKGYLKWNSKLSNSFSVGPAFEFCALGLIESYLNHFLFCFFVMGDVPELHLAQNCSGSTSLVFEGMAYKLRYTFPLPFPSFPLC